MLVWHKADLIIISLKTSLPNRPLTTGLKNKLSYLWNQTMLNLCGIVVAILKMATGRNFSMSGINSGHHYLPTYHILMISNNVEFLVYCGGILKTATGRNCSMSGINSGHHFLPTYQILMISGNVEFLPPIFYAVFWQPFWKWQTSWKFWKRRIAPLMVTYHYVKFYVSIIIHLEVINFNVWNFNFPIGFYSNPYHFEPLKIWLWIPLPQLRTN